jgi:16S rRNA (guanine527-N7)-methyltransferase
MIASEADARRFCAERTDAVGLERLERLAVLLGEENERQNLVSNASLASVWQRHFADSLQLLDHVPRGTSDWLDLGSGAGFPGLALAVAAPESRFVLVESRKRRVDWLTRAASELGLENCRVVGARLENVETFAAAVIVARAFAPLGKLLRLSARFSTPTTVWLLQRPNRASFWSNRASAGLIG